MMGWCSVGSFFHRRPLGLSFYPAYVRVGLGFWGSHPKTLIYDTHIFLFTKEIFVVDASRSNKKIAAGRLAVDTTLNNLIISTQVIGIKMRRCVISREGGAFAIVFLWFGSARGQHQEMIFFINAIIQ